MLLVIYSRKIQQKNKDMSLSHENALYRIRYLWRLKWPLSSVIAFKIHEYDMLERMRL